VVARSTSSPCPGTWPLTPVRTSLGESWILSRDEESFRTDEGQVAPTRLLPSGDAYLLLWGAERELLVEDAEHRGALWTSRVWPGAVMVEGEIVGTWQRAKHAVSVQTWGRRGADLGPPVLRREGAVESEATSLPLPDLDRPIVIDWDEPR
jgi:hypothetical protein